MNAPWRMLTDPQAARLALALLHLVWQAALVAVVLAVTLRLARNRSANARYALSLAAMALIAVAPVATFLVVDAPPRPAEVAAPVAVEPPPVTVETVVELPPAVAPLNRVPAVTPPAPEPEVRPHVKPAAAGWSRRALETVQPYLPHVVASWTIGVLLIGLWRLGGWMQVRRLTRLSAEAVPSHLEAAMRRLAGQMGVARPVVLLRSALATVPTVVGWLRPVVLLPVAALAGLTSEQLEVVLAHELAHIRRHDYLVNLLQVAVETLLFYHPAVWWVSARIRQEREHCCDDLALTVAGNRAAYARALETIARLHRGPALALSARGGSLLARIRRILGLRDAERFSPASWFAAALVLAVVGLVFYGCAVAGDREDTDGPRFTDTWIMVRNPHRPAREGVMGNMGLEGRLADTDKEFVGMVAHKYLRTTREGDVYEISRRYPRDSGTTTTVTVTYKGDPLVAFENDDQRIVLYEASAVKDLVAKLSDPDEGVRKTAYDKLMTLMGPALRRDIESIAECFKGAPGDGEAVKILIPLADAPEVQEAMLEGLREGSVNVRHCSIVVLGHSGNREHVPAIAAHVGDNTIASCVALAELGGDEAFEALLGALNRSDIEFPWLVAEQLARLGRPEAVPEIKKALARVTSDHLAWSARYVDAIRKIEPAGFPTALYSFANFHAVGDRGWTLLEGMDLDRMTSTYVQPFERRQTDQQTRAAAYEALAAKDGLDLAWEETGGNRLLAFNGVRLAPFTLPTLPQGYDVWADGERFLDQRLLAKRVESYNATAAVPEVRAGVRAYPFAAGDHFLVLLPGDRVAIIRCREIRRNGVHIYFNLTAKLLDPLYQNVPAAAFPEVLGDADKAAEGSDGIAVEYQMTSTFPVSDAGVTVVCTGDKGSLITAWTAPPKGELEFDGFSLQVDANHRDAQGWPQGMLLDKAGKAIAAYSAVKGDTIRCVGEAARDGRRGKRPVAFLLPDADRDTVEQAWSVLREFCADRAVLLVPGKLPSELRLSAVGKEGAASNAYEFGSVNEATVSLADVAKHGVLFIGLRANKLLRPPFAVEFNPTNAHFVSLTPELKEWLVANHVDAALWLGEKDWRMMGLGMQKADDPQGRQRWDTGTPTEVVEAFAAKDRSHLVRGDVPFSVVTYYDRDPDRSLTSFSFRTRDDSMGVLACEALQGSPQTIKLRWKFLQPAPRDAGNEAPEASRRPQLRWLSWRHDSIWGEEYDAEVTQNAWRPDGAAEKDERTLRTLAGVPTMGNREKVASERSLYLWFVLPDGPLLKVDGATLLAPGGDPVSGVSLGDIRTGTFPLGGPTSESDPEKINLGLVQLRLAEDALPSPVDIRVKYRLPQGAVGTTVVRDVILPLAAVKDEAAHSAGDPGRLVWSAPVERTIEDEPGRDSWIDFDTGTFITPPKEIHGGSTKKAIEWCRSHGIDASAEDALPGMNTMDMDAARLTPADWDGLTPEALRDVLADSARLIEPVKDTYPLGLIVRKLVPQRQGDVFAFKTREGTTGLLQILEVLDSGNLFKIRYKLARPAAAAAVTDLRPSDAEPGQGHWRIAPAQPVELRLHEFSVDELIRVASWGGDYVRRKIAEPVDLTGTVEVNGDRLLWHSSLARPGRLQPKLESCDADYPGSKFGTPTMSVSSAPRLLTPKCRVLWAVRWYDAAGRLLKTAGCLARVTEPRPDDEVPPGPTDEEIREALRLWTEDGRNSPEAVARQRFLAVERFARLPADEQAEQLPQFYRDVAPGSISGVVEMLLSSAPTNILDRDPAHGFAGNTMAWARQLADASAELTPEQVADKLDSILWLRVATRARAVQVLMKHAARTETLIREDLASREAARVDRSCGAFSALRLPALVEPLLEVFLADDALSEAAGRALLWVDDPAVCARLMDRVDKDASFLARCASQLQKCLYRKPAGPVLLRLLESADAEVRYNAGRAVYECADPNLAGPVAKFARDAEPRFRVMAAYLGSNLPAASFASARADLLPLLNDPDEEVRLQGLRCFAQQKDLAAGPTILDFLRGGHAGPAGQREVTVMQSLAALAGGQFGYDMHHWGADAPGNQEAIRRFEAWLSAAKAPGGEVEIEALPAEAKPVASLSVQLVNPQGQALEKQSLVMVPVSTGYSEAIEKGHFWADKSGKVTIKELAPGKHRFVVNAQWPHPTFAEFDVPEEGGETRLIVRPRSDDVLPDLDVKVQQRTEDDRILLDVTVTNNTDAAYTLTDTELQLVSIRHRVFPPLPQQPAAVIVPPRGKGESKFTLDWNQYVKLGLWCSRNGEDISWPGPTEDDQHMYYRVQVGITGSLPIPMPKPGEKRAGDPALEFRIAPSPTDLDEAELASCRDWLAAGRVGFWWKGGRAAGMAGMGGRMPRHAWLPIQGKVPDIDRYFVTGEHEGQRYLLVSDRPGETMPWATDGPDAWRLTKVAARDLDTDQPRIQFELDDRGAALFAALTQANLNRAMALIVRGEVISAPIVRTRLTKSGIIVGFRDAQQANDVARILQPFVADGAAVGPVETMQFKGRVVDRRGRPVEGVRVRLHEWDYGDAGRSRLDAAGAQTDAEGRFAVAAARPAAGSTELPLLLFEHADYGLAWYDWAYGRHRNVDPTRLKITLLPAASLSGAVTDGDGRPVVGASVGGGVGHSDYIGHPQALQLGVGTTTDDQGRFTIGRLPQGALVEPDITADGYAAFKAPDGHTYRAGTADVSLQLHPGSGIEGRLLRDGEPLPLAGLRVFADGDAGRRGALTDEQGRFRIEHLPSGTYRLTLSPLKVPHGLAQPIEPPKVEVGGGREPAKADLNLSPGVRVFGRKTDVATGKTPTQDPHWVPHSVHARAGRYEVAASGIDAEGRWEVFLAPGSYTLATTAYRDGVGFLHHVGLTVSQGDEPHEVNIAVPWKRLIRGRLVDADGRGVAGTVECFGNWVTSEADGTFEMHEPFLSPSQECVWLAGQDAEGRRGRFVQVMKDAVDQPLTIVVEPLAAVVGKVALEDGSAAANVEVSVGTYGKGVRRLPQQATTDDGGAFRIEGIPVGAPLQLAVHEPHCETVKPIGTPAPGQALDAGVLVANTRDGFDKDAVLDAVIAGRVLDDRGNPLAGCTVTSAEGTRDTTDAEGRFRLEGMPRDKAVLVQAKREGYVTVAVLSKGEDNKIRLRPSLKPLFDKPAPELSAERWFNSPPLRLADLRGKVVLLHMAACFPNRGGAAYGAYAEWADRPWKQYRDRGLVVIGVHVNFGDAELPEMSDDEIKAYLDKWNIGFPFAVDSARAAELPKDFDGATCSRYHASTSPTAVLIDKQGRVRCSPTTRDIDAWIEKLLAEPAAGDEAGAKSSAAGQWCEWSAALSGIRFRARTLAAAVTKEDRLPVEIEVRNTGNEALYVLHPDRLPDDEASVRYDPFILIEGRHHSLAQLPLEPTSRPEWYVLLEPDQSVSGKRDLFCTLPAGQHWAWLTVPHGWSDDGAEAKGAWPADDVRRISAKAWRISERDRQLGPLTLGAFVVDQPRHDHDAEFPKASGRDEGVPAAADRVALPGGAVVRILGVRPPHQTDDMPWYAADGGAEVAMPYARPGVYEHPPVERHYVAFEITGVPPDAQNTRMSRPTFMMAASEEGSTPWFEGDGRSRTMYVMMAVPRESLTSRFLFVPQPEWHDAGEFRPGRLDETVTVNQFADMPPAEFRLLDIADKDGKAVVTFEERGRVTLTRDGRPVSNYDISMSALDKNGRAIRHSQGPAYAGRGGTREGSVTFDLLHDEIAVIRLHVRPYHWIEFQNISSGPGDRTELKTILRRAAGRFDPTGTSAAAMPPSERPVEMVTARCDAAQPEARLPNGGTLKLLALTAKGKWWSADGSPLEPQADWKRFESGGNDPAGAVLEVVYPGAAAPTAKVGPAGELWAIPCYNRCVVKSAASGRGPELVVGMGAGPWKTAGTLTGAGRIESGELVCEITEVKTISPRRPRFPGSGASDVRFWMTVVPETNAALVAVGRDGQEKTVAHTYGVTDSVVARNTRWNLPATVQMDAADIDHFELRTQPRAWAKFVGFATSPSDDALAELPGLPVHSYDLPPSLPEGSAPPMASLLDGSRQPDASQRAAAAARLKALKQIQDRVRSGEAWQSQGGRAAVRFLEGKGTKIELQQAADGHWFVDRTGRAAPTASSDAHHVSREADMRIEVRQTPEGHEQVARLIDQMWTDILNRDQRMVSVESRFILTEGDDAAAVDRWLAANAPDKVAEASDAAHDSRVLDAGRAEAFLALAGAQKSAATIFAPRLALWSGHQARISDAKMNVQEIARLDRPGRPRELVRLDRGCLLQVRTTASDDSRSVRLNLHPRLVQDAEKGGPADPASPLLLVAELSASLDMPDGATAVLRVPVPVQRLLGVTDPPAEEAGEAADDGGSPLKAVFGQAPQDAAKVLWLLVKPTIIVEDAAGGARANIPVPHVPIRELWTVGVSDKLATVGDEEVPWSEASGGLQCRLLPVAQTIAPEGAPKYAEDARVEVSYEVRNVSKQAVQFMATHYALEGVWVDVVEVRNPDGTVGKCYPPDGAPKDGADKDAGAAAFRSANRDPKPDTKFVPLGPGQMIRRRVLVPYDFTKPGRYTLSIATQHSDDVIGHYYVDDAPKRAENPDHVWTGALRSNTVTLDVRPQTDEQRGSWGEAVEGVQVRLRAEKVQWKAGEEPVFALDLHNGGGRVLSYLPLAERECEVEWDGQSYRWNSGTKVKFKLPPVKQLGPDGTAADALKIKVTDSWLDMKQQTPLQLRPGKHTVRVTLSAEVSGDPGKGNTPLRAVSNAVEIEILPDLSAVPDVMNAYMASCEFLGGGGSRTEAARLLRAVSERSSVQPTDDRTKATARELADLLAAMAKDDETFVSPQPPLTEQQKVDLLIHRLRDVAEKAYTVPGRVKVLMRQDPDSPARQLADMGPAVVPQMIALLGDRRPTRSVDDALNGGHVLRYCDVALQIIEHVAGHPDNQDRKLFDERTSRGTYLGNADDEARELIVARVKAWWAAERAKAAPDDMQPKQLPGSRLSLAEAAAGGFTVAAVCVATDDVGVEDLDTGVHEYATSYQKVDIVETLAGEAPAGGLHGFHYTVFRPHVGKPPKPGLDERDIRKGERVIWIIRQVGDRFRGIKALPDTADNRDAAARLVVEEPVRGESVEGVQVRLWADNAQWRAGEYPVLHAEARNRGPGSWHVPACGSLCWLQTDGQWYVFVGDDPSPSSWQLKPGGAVPPFALQLGDGWRQAETGRALRLVPGTHTVHLAFDGHGGERGQYRAVRAVSNPVEITVLPGAVAPVNEITPREAFRLALTHDLSFGRGLGRTQPGAIAAWEVFLKTPGITPEQEYFATWRIASLCAYNLDPARGEKPDMARATEMFGRCRQMLADRLADEIVNTATVYASLPGPRVDHASRLAECYRWARTRTEEMIKASAPRVSDSGGVVPSDAPPASGSDVTVLSEEGVREAARASVARREEGLRKKVQFAVEHLTERVTQFIQSSREKDAVDVLLKGIEGAADPAALATWRAMREQMNDLEPGQSLRSAEPAADRPGAPRGEAAEGVQVRLRADKRQWKTGETPMLLVDVQNGGKEQIVLGTVLDLADELQVDGRSYRHPLEDITGARWHTLAAGGTRHNALSLAIDGQWSSVENRKPLSLTPGRHSVRFAWQAYRQPPEAEGPTPDKDRPLRLISNAVEIEILSPKARPEPRLPGSALSLGEAIKGGLVFAAVCEAEDEAGLVCRDTGVHEYATSYQKLRVLEILVGQKPAGGVRAFHYTAGQPYEGRPPHEREINKGERVIWLVRQVGDRFRGVKALADTPDNREAVKRLAADAAWGEAAEGVQVRLRADRARWTTGESPTLLADVRNQGTRDLRVTPLGDFELEFDGQWYRWAGGLRSPVLPLGPGREYEDLGFALSTRTWTAKGGDEKLELEPGKHTVRVAFICRPNEKGAVEPPPQAVRAVSNEIQIEIFPGEFFVDGLVQRRGVYSMPRVHPLTLARALTAAGGVTAPAKDVRVTITRRLADDKEESIDVDLSAVYDGTAEDPTIGPNDYIRVWRQQPAPATPDNGQGNTGPAAGPPATVAGRVVQLRVLPSSNVGYRLDTGEQFDVPSTTPAELQTWSRQKSVDVLAGDWNGLVALWPVDAVSAHVDASWWERFDPAEAAKALRDAKGAAMCAAELPATYVVRTRNGQFAVVQFTAVEDSPRAATARYRVWTVPKALDAEP